MKITKKHLQLTAFLVTLGVIVYIALEREEAAVAIITAAFALLGTILAGFPQ